VLAALIVVSLVGCTAREPEVLQPPAGSLTPSMFQFTAGGSTETVVGARVDRDFFQTMKVAPLLGRTILAQDTSGVVVLQEALWRRRFNGEPSIIGQTVQLDGASTVIIGVMPSTFRLPGDLQLFVPRVP
jgi:hypothetical protein